MIHTVKGFGIVNKVEINVFLELSCFFDDPEDVGNLISYSSAFSKTSLNIWSRQTENHSHKKLTNLITWTTALSSLMILWATPCRATRDGRLMVESSDKTWSTGEGNGKPLQYSCLENPMNSMKMQNNTTLKDELPRLVGAQHATGYQWRSKSRKNEQTEPKQKQHPVVDVTGDGSNVWCCKEQYCIGTWNVRSMNQGKLEVIKQEMARVNVDILGISKLRWTGMGEFNSDDH